MPELSIALDEGHQSRGSLTLEHTILREGRWKHPKAPGGVLNIDGATLGELEKNFNAGVGLAKDAIPFHVGHTEHLDDRAAAWAKIRVVDDPDRPGKRKMVSLAHYTTPDDFERVRTGQYAYVSPTIDFGYTDKESGSRYGAVLRNVALTNYPYIKQMGPAKVVNLSEIAAGNDDPETVALAGGLGYEGTSASGDPNYDGLPANYDPTDLPKQCLACARLGNDCPFSAPEANADLMLKQAAAGSGNCPQYVEADSNQPGGGGGADAAVTSPAQGRSNTGRAQMSDLTPDYTPKDSDTMGDLLHSLRESKRRAAYHGTMSDVGQKHARIADEIRDVIRGKSQALKQKDATVECPACSDKNSSAGCATCRGSGVVFAHPAPMPESTPKSRSTAQMSDTAADAPATAPATGNGPGVMTVGNGDDTGDFGAAHAHLLHYLTHYGGRGQHWIGGHIWGPKQASIDGGDLNRLVASGHIATQAVPVPAISKGGKPNQVTHYVATDKGRQAMAQYQDAHPTPIKLNDPPLRGKTRPTRASKGTTTMSLSEAQISKLVEQVKASRAEAQEAFLLSLSETHRLPADALKAIKSAFDAGETHSVALAEAIGDATIALSEAESAVDLEGPATAVDLSDALVLPKQTVRDLIAIIAGGSTGVKLSETQAVPGRPRQKAVLPNGNDGNGEMVALAEELAALSPDEAVARMREYEKTGK